MVDVRVIGTVERVVVVDCEVEDGEEATTTPPAGVVGIAVAKVPVETGMPPPPPGDEEVIAAVGDGVSSGAM